MADGGGAGLLGLPEPAARELARQFGGEISPGDVQIHYDDEGRPRKIKATRVWRVQDLVAADRERRAAKAE